MPIFDYVSQGAEKVVGDIQKQIQSLGKLQQEINACNGDTAKMTEVVKAFVLSQDSATKSTKKLSAAEREQAKEAADIERILGKQLTRAQRLGQEYRTLSNHLRQLKLNPESNADQIRRTEAALKRIREELRQNTAEFKRNADAAAAGMNIARQAVERNLTPLERYRRGVMQVNEALRQNKITGDAAKVAQQQLWRDYQAGIAKGNKDLGFMSTTLLPGIKNQVVSIAGAFGLGLGVAGMISKAREELQKLNDIRKQMQAENVSVAAVEVALGEVIGHKDPEYLSFQKERVRTLADKMQLPYTTIFPLVHDTISASMETSMDAKIDDALEVSEAAALMFPHDPQKARETALGAQNIRKWDSSIKNAKEAVGRVQMLGLAGQVADMKKVAENAPRAIGAVAPFGDSPAFGAALWGEGTHLMTDPHGAMEVGFVSRMEKFLFDFSQARDKKTGELLNPEMADLKTGEERLRYIQKISMERPDAIQGEMIEYLKGLSPEKTAAILDDAVNMTEEQLKLPEQFIKAMKGKGLAIQWGPMVMMLTNKEYIKRLQDRIDEMKKMWGDAEGFFEADLQSRRGSYKPLLADLKIKWLKERSASEYSSAGIFNEFREALVKDMPLRAGSPAISREWANLKDLLGAVQNWEDMHGTISGLVSKTAGNNFLTPSDRLKGVKVLSEGLALLESMMPEENLKKIKTTSGQNQKQALDTIAKQVVANPNSILSSNNKFSEESLIEFVAQGGNIQELQSRIVKEIEKRKKYIDEIDQRNLVTRVFDKGAVHIGLSNEQIRERNVQAIVNLEKLDNMSRNLHLQPQNKKLLPDLPQPFAVPKGDIPIEQKIKTQPRPDLEPPQVGDPVSPRLRLSPENEAKAQELLRRRDEEHQRKLAEAAKELSQAVKVITPIIERLQKNEIELARQRSFGHPWLRERPEADIRHV